MPLLDVRNVNASYEDFHILKDVSISVEANEILSVVGANSAGKSTLLKLISGMIDLDKGDILFQGNCISALTTHEIARLGVIQVPEGRRMFPLMTVFENLLVGSILDKARKKRSESIEYVYNLFPVLKERRGQLAGTLSGGEQQMLAIARGLMALPILLMLDEPSVGLAPIMAENIFKVIKEIDKQNITILLVEQNVQRSLSIAKRGYVLETGRIKLQGTGEELLANPYVKEAYLGL